MPLSTFQCWRKKLEPAATTSDFIELLPPEGDDCPAEAWAVEVDLPGGLSLRIRGGC